MPFTQAATAAGGGCVLGDKHRMAAHRRLFSVIGRFCRCQPGADKLCGVLPDQRPAFLLAITIFRAAQMKALTERGAGKPLEEVIDRVHSRVVSGLIRRIAMLIKSFGCHCYRARKFCAE